MTKGKLFVLKHGFSSGFFSTTDKEGDDAILEQQGVTVLWGGPYGRRCVYLYGSDAILDQEVEIAIDTEETDSVFDEGCGLWRYDEIRGYFKLHSDEIDRFGRLNE